MYERIFELRDDEPVCDLVSHRAALVYAGLTYYADAIGRVKTWTPLIGALSISYRDLNELIDELLAAGLIGEFTIQVPIAEIRCGIIYGSQRCFQLTNFVPPDRLDRLSSKAWAELRTAAFERDDYTCQYCFERGGELECDHVVPIARGGTNELGNLVTACKGCNRQKRDKALEEWRA